MKRTFSPILSAVLVVTGCVWSAAASANGFDVYGAGARGSAMGNAATSTADDFTAVYYNPAAMVMGSSSIGGGFLSSFNQLDIRLADRPDGYDVPNAGSSTPTIPSEFRLRERGTQDLSAYGMFYIGATSTLGIENLRVGAIALVPVLGGETQQSRFADEREALFTNELSWELLGSRVQHPAFQVAAAYQIIPMLSLGIGVSYMPGADTNNFVYVPDISDQGDVDINVRLKIPTRLRPIAGLLFTPTDELRVGVSFRDQQYLEVSGVNEVQVRGFQDTDDYPFFQKLDLVLQYSPRQFALGISYAPGPWLFSADLLYALWSDYPNNHAEQAGFSDTLSPRFGTEYTLHERHHFRLGGAWEPSPVGPQRGRTNYVDNDRIVVSVGTGHDFAVAEGQTFRVGWYAQFHAMTPREHIKRTRESYEACTTNTSDICDEIPDDAINPATGQPWEGGEGLQTSNPGFPGYSSGGWLGSAGLEATWLF